MAGESTRNVDPFGKEFLRSIYARLEYVLWETKITDEMRDMYFGSDGPQNPTDQEMAAQEEEKVEQEGGVISGRQSLVAEPQISTDHVEEKTDDHHEFALVDQEQEIHNVAEEKGIEIQEMKAGVRQHEKEIQETKAEEDHETLFPPLIRSEKSPVEEPRKSTNHHMEETTEEVADEEKEIQNLAEEAVRQEEIKIQKMAAEELRQEDRELQEMTAEEVREEEEVVVVFSGKTSFEESQKSVDQESASEEAKQDQKEQESIDVKETTQELAEEKKTQDAAAESAGEQEQKTPESNLDYENHFPPLMRTPKLTKRETRVSIY